MCLWRDPRRFTRQIWVKCSTCSGIRKNVNPSCIDYAGAINSSPGFLNYSSNFIDQNGLDIIFTTIASLPDSSGSQPPTVPVKYAEKLGLYPLGLFRCHVSPVTQTAVLDAQSLQIMSLEPTIMKTSSTWLPVSWTAQAPADVNDPLGALDVSLIDMVSETPASFPNNGA